MISRFILTTAVCVACLNSVDAAIITTADSSNGEDSYVQQNSPGTNFNGGIIRALPSNQQIGYLRFDISGFVDDSFTGTSTLQLTNTNVVTHERTIEVYGINDGSAGDLVSAWDETTLTASNQPGLGAATSLGTFFGGGFATGTVDSFTTGITGFLNDDTNGLASFILVATSFPSATSAEWFSKEGDSGNSAPALAVVAAVPEPSTFALLGLGAIGFVAHRRRRRVPESTS